jgi:hypothetical protein
MIKSENLPNTRHLKQEAQHRASAIARRRRPPATENKIGGHPVLILTTHCSNQW